GPHDVPPAEWSARYGCYLPDRVTPAPVDQMPLARAIRGEAVDDAEEFIRNPHRPNGVWLSVNARPLRDEAGAIKGGVSVYRDVTAHRRAEEALRASEKRWHGLFENSPDAIFVNDLDGTILDVNAAGCRLCGRERGELVGTNLVDLVPPTMRSV